ncbi:MAG: hypothetical protein TREMPRED_004548 [Tremellales sp. Tagirdzhanova-0007]|nr:MAG: hypothetical protein TREMPRED_004548 [Tremellales sp. Tagirdzhanova-0007]
MASFTAAHEPPSQSTSASTLQKAKVNLTYLAYGSKASIAPASLATRSALTTTRYVLRYAIRRLVRYAKYAAVGAVMAAVGTTLLGTVGSGLAFFAAPGIGAGMGIGVITAIFGWRHRGEHFRGGVWEGMKLRAREGRDGATDEQVDAGSLKREREKDRAQERRDVWMRM